MTNLATTSPNDDLPSQLGLQSPPSWGRFESYRTQLTSAGLNDDDANAAALLLESDNVFGIEDRSDADNTFAESIASKIGIMPLDDDDDLSTQAAFEAFNRFDFGSCENGMCSLSTEELAFLDESIDELPELL